jgi:ankyrin repeat protein
MLGDVSVGDIVAEKNFLDKGGNVNLQDEPGMTPLHHAVNADWKGRNHEMVKQLIDRGANVKAIYDTPLHLASNKETAEFVIDAGADVNAKTQRTGETLLYLAAWGATQGHPKSHQMCLSLAKLLIAKGANVNVKLKSGETTLHRVARSFSENMLLRFVNC